MYNILSLRELGRKILAENDEYRIIALETDLILSHVLKKDRIYLDINKDETVNVDLANEFVEKINKRKNKCPMAYIIGHKEFMEYDFLTEEGILIPRNDTESLINLTLDNIENKNKYLQAIEIGTGSGIISITLATKLLNLDITACDINDKSISLANKNIIYIEEQIGNIKLRDRINIIKSDLFSEIDSNKRVDFVISNPPYIETHIIKTLSEDIKNYEPINALDGGFDGLYFYREILDKGYDLVKEGGFFVFEIGYNQYDSVEKLMIEKKLKNIMLYKDLSGLDRAIIGFK